MPLPAASCLPSRMQMASLVIWAEAAWSWCACRAERCVSPCPCRLACCEYPKFVARELLAGAARQEAASKMWMGQGHTRPALLSRRRIMACSCAAGHASHGLSASGHSSLRNDEGNAGAIGSCACANGQGEIESHPFLIGQPHSDPSGRSEAVGRSEEHTSE